MGNMWVLNNMYGLVDQCVCIEPHSTAGAGSHNLDPIFPVIYNWTNNLNYLARERIEVEYGIGEMDLEHWIFGPHHAWTAVGSNQLVRMWQPYNGFEIFAPGTVKDDTADPESFGSIPPALCVKGGALARIGCTDEGYPSDSVHPGDAPDMSPDPSEDDLKRARSKVPRATRKGDTFKSMSEKLNSVIKQYGNTKECA